MEGEAMFGKLLSKVIINCGSEDEWPGIKAAKTRDLVHLDRFVEFIKVNGNGNQVGWLIVD